MIRLSLRRATAMVWIVAALICGPARAQMQAGQTGFTYPDLGLADRMTVDPYYDTFYGLTFTALPLGNVAGEVGLVRSFAAVCVFPGDPDQMLGTAVAGSGDIGTGTFPIRVDFPNPLLPPVSVRLDVHTYAAGVVTVTLFDENDAPIAAARETNPVAGTCPGPATRRDYILMLAQSTPVDHVVIACEYIFTIDNFTWIEQFLPVESATWGRVKALFRADRAP